MEALALLTMDTIKNVIVEEQCICLLAQFSAFWPHTTVHLENNHVTVGGAINVHDVNSFSYCALIAKYLPREEYFFNSLSRICPGISTFNLSLKTTLLMMQEVCYMVAK